jgi:hypothetical protein
LSQFGLHWTPQSTTHIYKGSKRQPWSRADDPKPGASLRVMNSEIRIGVSERPAPERDENRYIPETHCEQYQEHRQQRARLGERFELVGQEFTHPGRTVR